MFEWTSSLYKAYPYSATDGREDVASREPRVLRGGSFYGGIFAGSVRSAYRIEKVPGCCSDTYGFRVVASPIPR